AENVEAIIKAESERSRDVSRGRRVGRLIAGHAVDVGRLQAGIYNSLADRLARHREGCAVRGPHMRSLADTHDAILVSEIAHLFSRNSFRNRSSHVDRTYHEHRHVRNGGADHSVPPGKIPSITLKFERRPGRNKIPSTWGSASARFGIFARFSRGG